MPTNWYWPNSAGSRKLLNQLASQCAGDFPELLLNLAKTATDNHAAAKYFSLDDIHTTQTSRALSERLGSAFTRHGSDKSTIHNYHLLYGEILNKVSIAPKILEIGLGSNNTDFASHMGVNGKPGASLKAFREVFADAEIYGADIDHTIEVEGEKVFYFDQTNPASFDELRQNGSGEYHLIIDDGLHSPNANIATLTFALSKITSDGAIVIEDIPKRALDVWNLVDLLLADRYRTALIRTQHAYVFLCTPLSSPLINDLFQHRA